MFDYSVVQVEDLLENGSILLFMRQEDGRVGVGDDSRSLNSGREVLDLLAGYAECPVTLRIRRLMFSRKEDECSYPAKLGDIIIQASSTMMRFRSCGFFLPNFSQIHDKSTYMASVRTSELSRAEMSKLMTGTSRRLRSSSGV